MKELIEQAFLYRLMLYGIPVEDQKRYIPLLFDPKKPQIISDEYMDEKTIYKLIKESTPHHIVKTPNANQAYQAAREKFKEYMVNLSDAKLIQIFQEQYITPAIKAEAVGVAIEKFKDWQKQAARLFANDARVSAQSAQTWNDLAKVAQGQTNFKQRCRDRSVGRNLLFVSLVILTVIVYWILSKVIRGDFKNQEERNRVHFILNGIIVPTATAIFIGSLLKMPALSLSVDITRFKKKLDTSFTEFAQSHYQRHIEPQDANLPLAQSAAGLAELPAPTVAAGVDGWKKDIKVGCVRGSGKYPSFMAVASASAASTSDSKVRFEYHKVQYIAALDEKAMPADKLENIKKAFVKEFRDRSGEQTGVTGIVVDNENPDARAKFKITLAEAGRVKCAFVKEEKGPDGGRVIHLNFNLYDANAHDLNRARFPVFVTTPNP